MRSGGTVMLRYLTALAVCIVLGLSIGFAFAANPDKPNARASNQAEKLDKVQRDIRILRTGLRDIKGTLRQIRQESDLDHRKICAKLDAYC
jgi:hypothetical protein